jgi:transcription antitermination factor NusG
MSNKSVRVSWKRGRMYVKTNPSFYDHLWKKAKAKSYSSVSDAGYDYWMHVTDAASLAAFDRNEDDDPNLSAETLSENGSLIGFKAFAQEFPDKLFPLIYRLRPEFQEIFIEFWLLSKSQSFIGKAHGQIQTRIWQALRIIEQAIGSLIILGTNPDAAILRPIITKAGLEDTTYGSLTNMILLYAPTQNYALVAKILGAPIPAIRKIFRPAIGQMLASKDVYTVAVGAYLRSLTHQASLTGAGLSKRCLARTRRVKNLRFVAPPSDTSPLLSFGSVSVLRDTEWFMFEISSVCRMNQIAPVLKTQGKRIFGKQPAQIFAPVNAEGELIFGYVFARSTVPALTRSLTRIRGVSEMAATCSDDTQAVQAVAIPDAEVQTMIASQNVQKTPQVRVGDFVEVLTGIASKYCGTATKVNAKTEELTIEINFPTGRRFIVTADPTCVKLLPKTPILRRGFWGVKV